MRTLYVLIVFWIVVLVVVLGAVLVGAVMIWREWFDVRPAGPLSMSECPEYPPLAYPQEPPSEEPPSLGVPILYQLSRQWVADVGRPVGVAVDGKDRIYVAGQARVQVFDQAGTVLAQWELKEPARCIGAAPAHHCRPGAVYLGYAGRVEIRTEKGGVIGAWPLPAEKAEPTSIALAEKEIFVADAAAQCVYRFDAEGKLLGQIGKPDAARGYPGLVLPSPYCDVAVDAAGLVWVANPGLLRLEAYRPEDGRLERFWDGKGPGGESGFFGCCNPAHFCILPDGRFVTAEKGRLRLKVYSADGDLLGWVVSPSEWQKLAEADRAVPQAVKPEHCTERIEAADVAADSQGRIAVLYLANSRVYLFEPSDSPASASPEASPTLSEPGGDPK